MAGPDTGNYQKTFQLDQTATVDVALYRFVTQVGSQTVKQADAAGQRAIGVAQNPCTVAQADLGNSGGREILVVIEGTPLVEASASIAVDQRVSTTNDGRAKVAVTGEVPLGIARKAAVAGEWFPVQLTPGVAAI